MKIEEITVRAREENILTSVLLELTYSCNLNCFFCYNDLGLKGRRVSIHRYVELLDELADLGVMYLVLSGGEPLLYDKFYELGAHARKRGFVVRVKSNGAALNQRNAERLKAEVDPFTVELSIHGACAETHDRLTQVTGSFDRLLKNIELLRSVGLRLKLNSALTRWNEAEVRAMFELSDRLGIPLRFDPEVTPRDDGDRAPLEIAASREGVENMVRETLEHKLRKARGQRVPVRFGPQPNNGRNVNPDRQKVCGAGSTNLVIDPFGNVYPCVQFRRKAGNIHEQGIREIWTGSRVLGEVRDLAGRALEVAKKEGLRQFCMGVNELREGDPLKSPESKREADRIYQRINWEFKNIHESEEGRQSLKLHSALDS